MVNQEKDIKEKIIHATIELIIKHGDTSKITVRELAGGAPYCLPSTLFYLKHMTFQGAESQIF